MKLTALLAASAVVLSTSLALAQSAGGPSGRGATTGDPAASSATPGSAPTTGSFQAVYNGTKAFLDSFSFALREELRDTKITVTCLMPGATETRFFERADMMDASASLIRTMRPQSPKPVSMR